MLTNGGFYAIIYPRKLICFYEDTVKKIVFVAAPPACGKNYVSELICRNSEGIAYFDKDDLAILLRRSFELCGEAVDMDGRFYLENLRAAEYETLFGLAFSALRFSDLVLVNAPLLKEVRDGEFMCDLRRRARLLGAEMILVWVVASREVCYERMRQRGLDRDTEKLAEWDSYVSRVDYSAPDGLVTSGAIDRLFVFDNENEAAAEASLKALLGILQS